MRHDELARVTLRSLAYAELCAESPERDGCALLDQLQQAVGRQDGSALAFMIDGLAGQVSSPQIEGQPPLLRGSVRYG